MNAEANAFLDAIFAAPDDDTPKLVYADWLEENGHGGYAEFVRVCCRLATDDWPAGLRTAGLAERRERIGKLIRTWEAREGRPLPIDPRGCHRRGIFEGTIRTTAAEFLANAEPWFPLLHVRWVQVNGFADADQAREWAAHPFVAAVRLLAVGPGSTSLFLGGGEPLAADRVTAALASPHLGRLDRLTVGPVWASRRFLSELAGLPAVRQARPDGFSLLVVGVESEPNGEYTIRPGRQPLSPDRSIRAFLESHGNHIPDE